MAFRPLLCKLRPLASKHAIRSVSKKSFIQPLPATHPELLRKDELLPFTKTEEFATRRSRLAELIRSSLTKDATDHLIIIPSASKLYMSANIPYVFRQNSDFLYFTGCFQPDCVLVMKVTSSDEKSYLFVPPSDPHSELWEGSKFEAIDIPDLFNMKGLPTTNIEKNITDIVRDKQYNIWYDITQRHSSLSQRLQKMALALGSKKTENPVPLFHQLRVFKSESEISLMKKAGDIGALSLRDTMAISKPDIEEFRLWTEMEYRSKLRGAQILAYPPVVAGGNRANTIHYIYNNNKALNGDLVLMDAGCEYFGYSSDITRTWPINGKFSEIQKALYEAILDAQVELINETCKAETLDALYMTMCKLLGRNLANLGLVKASSDRELYRIVGKYCPHHVSHFLGMDVHDVPNAPRNIRLRPGMVLTIEPGVYIPETDLDSAKEFRGLGIRIEDDVVITEDGPLVLSEKCPKGVSELERIVGSLKGPE